MNRVPSVAQILVTRLLAAWALSSFIMAVWNVLGSEKLRAFPKGGRWVFEMQEP